MLDEVVQFNKERQPPQFPMRLEMPEVPRAFINHDKIKTILCHTAEEFGHEEQLALYFYCYLNASISEISEKVGLSQNHIASVIGLYSERLTSQLNLFKKAMPYDADDTLPVSEILIPQSNIV